MSPHVLNILVCVASALAFLLVTRLCYKRLFGKRAPAKGDAGALSGLLIVLEGALSLVNFVFGLVMAACGGLTLGIVALCTTNIAAILLLPSAVVVVVALVFAAMDVGAAKG